MNNPSGMVDSIDSMDEKLNGMDEKLNSMDEKLNSIENRLNNIAEYANSLYKLADDMDKLADDMDTLAESIDNSTGGIDKPAGSTDKTVFSMFDATNQSIGPLGRLPPELRNRIYKFTLEDDDDNEVDTGGVCRPCGSRYQLAFVSKQIYNETVGIIEAVHRGPCNHWAFTIQVPAIPQSSNRYVVGTDASRFAIQAATIGIKKTIKAHNPFKRGATYCFRSAHLGGRAPDAVIVKLSKSAEQTQPEIEVVGGAHGLTAEELHRLESKLRGKVMAVPTGKDQALAELATSHSYDWMSLMTFTMSATAVYHYIRLRIAATAHSQKLLATEEKKAISTDEQMADQQ